ncbi:protein translocase subunit SecD [Gammaproteobacteria bacterium AH-315-C21]|nr:protein translocase subunit SecD [Gammaproteobacteria bacterium AH-315-C21]
MNHYPAWKYLLVGAVLVFAVLYALPNVYVKDYAIQVSAERQIDEDGLGEKLNSLLAESGLPYKSVELTDFGWLVRFSDDEVQSKAQEMLKEGLGRGYTTALNLAATTPAWLRGLGGEPMNLGLDLRGGVHFLLQVDMETAEKQVQNANIKGLRTYLRGEKIRYLSIVEGPSNTILIKFRSAEDRTIARELIYNEADYRSLNLQEIEGGKSATLEITVKESALKEKRDFALKQNITILRKRVNELGVAEPIIQQQGADRIVVQLPGVQDTARAKGILGATATLDFRLVDSKNDVQVALSGKVPLGSRIYRKRDGSPVLLLKDEITTGDSVLQAASTIDQTTGSPAVSIRLDDPGAKRMLAATRDNIGKPMAVVFKETKIDLVEIDGEQVKKKRLTEQVISIATINAALSSSFIITGLDSAEEARDLALLLRAGALKVPIDIIEERTIGPSMGKENIEKGTYSVAIGFIFVLVFMVIWYKQFGMIANIALALNLVVIVAVLSMLQATLTLPGIAGIVLTVGMAVDANVLIFERIREEIANGNSPQASIHSGYEKALSTIADANITTLIAALVLYTFGTGPIKGFAVTLSIGILTSMFTAIMGTRAIVNFFYGGKRVSKLSI